MVLYSPPKPMTSAGLSNSMKETHVLVRPTYINLYKWPESDAEFVKTVSSKLHSDSQTPPTAVHSFSCRQLYLRSYTFSKKKEGVAEKTIKCLNRAGQRVAGGISRTYWNGKKCFMLRRSKDVSSAAFFTIFHRLFKCSAKVDHPADL